MDVYDEINELDAAISRLKASAVMSCLKGCCAADAFKLIGWLEELKAVKTAKHDADFKTESLAEYMTYIGLQSDGEFETNLK